MKAKHEKASLLVVCLDCKSSATRHVINGYRTAALLHFLSYTIDLLYSDVSLRLKVRRRTKVASTSVFPLDDIHV